MDVVHTVNIMKAMAKRARAVSDMEIDEISLVDRPANQHALVTIAKRAQEDAVADEEFYDETGEVFDLDDVVDGDIIFDAEGNAFQFSDDDAEGEYEGEYAQDELVGAGIEKGVWSALKEGVSGYKAAANSGRLASQAGMAGIPEAEAAHANTLMTAAKTPAGQRGIKAQNTFGGSTGKRVLVGAGVAGAGGAGYAGGRRMQKNFETEIREELAKALTDSDRDAVLSKALGQIAEYEGEIAEAQEIAKSERDLRLTREYIAKAAEYNVPIDPEELGPVLYRMAEYLDYDDCAVIHKALSTSGALFEELGFAGEADNDDPWTEVDRRLDAQVSKSSGALSKAAATTDFFDSDPAAYDEYVAQNFSR